MSEEPDPQPIIESADELGEPDANDGAEAEAPQPDEPDGGDA